MRRKTPNTVVRGFHAAEQLQDTGATVRAGDMEMFSVAYASGSTVRQVVCGVNCGACKVCLTSAVLLQTIATYI
jgi:hypothetical protein